MSNQKDKQLSDTGKIIGINLIAALAYMGLQTVMEGIFALALMHGLVAAFIGFIMLFSAKTRSAGAAMILAGIIIFIGSLTVFAKKGKKVKLV